jgi:hypothetical protein
VVRLTDGVTTNGRGPTNEAGPLARYPSTERIAQMARKTKRTLRKMPSLARELAKLANEAASINTRMMNLTEKIADVEGKAAALDNFMVTVEGLPPEEPAS